MVDLASEPDKATNESVAQSLQEVVQENAAQLKESLQQQDWNTTIQLLARINKVRDQALYDEVAKLTRELHSALLDFQIDPRNPHGKEMSQINDANERLQYVIKMTEQAANDTIDLVEKSAPLVNYISYEAQSLTADWQRFMRREMSVEEFRKLTKRVSAYLERGLHDSDELSGNLNQIMMAQSFQDLTGQVIKRVTTQITDMEDSLLKLVVLASDVDRLAGIEHNPDELRKAIDKQKMLMMGEGPQIRADNNESVVNDQVDVDDLLSSLGI